MLPEALLLLLNAALALAQTRQTLSLNALASFNSQALPNPPSFTLPSQDQLSVSIALCASSSTLPRFFVTNSTNSATENDPGSGGGIDVFEINLQNGQGSWIGGFPNGGVLAVEANGAQVKFEVGVSNAGPMHQVLSSLPLLGDTTANQALVFSPPFSKPNYVPPTYPNYTLPVANPSLPDRPSSTPNFTLIVTPTSSNAASGPQTGCFLSSQKSAGNNANQTLWLRDQDGWRDQWLMGGLTPATNYTAYVLQDSTKVSGPIFFATKSAAFSCPLVASLPYCPGVAYPIPLPAPPGGAVLYDSTNLPTNVTDPLLSYLTNFTTTLNTFPCGRDWYSPIVGCDDCQRAYRRWLCAITFTRCGEPSPLSPGSFTSSPAAPSATGLSASTVPDPANQDAQQVLSALVPQDTGKPELARNQNFPRAGSAYSMLLPCIETCTAVDRMCPAFLGFKCPTANFNAAASYGVGYIDSADGDEGAGVTKTAQDRWGNIWCNAG